MSTPTGILLVVSGPSGSGKTTLCHRLTSESGGRVSYSISCTTRAPRPGEQNGVDYHFLTTDEFGKLLKEGKFLEWAEVHGNIYGTLLSEVEDRLLAGKDVVMDIDVQGAKSIRACTNSVIRKAYVDVFIGVGQEELEARLRGRCTDCEDVINLRLKNSLEENQYRGTYQYSFDSRDRESDYSRFYAIVEEARKKHRID